MFINPGEQCLGLCLPPGAEAGAGSAVLGSDCCSQSLLPSIGVILGWQEGQHGAGSLLLSSSSLHCVGGVRRNPA